MNKTHASDFAEGQLAYMDGYQSNTCPYEGERQISWFEGWRYQQNNGNIAQLFKSTLVVHNKGMTA